MSVEQASKQGLAQGYHWAFGFPYAVDDSDLHIPALLPAGLLMSSAEDMSHYLIAQLNEGNFGRTSVLSPTGVAMLHTPSIPADIGGPGASYGMGWVIGPIAGVPAIWHDGVTGAFHSMALLEPQNQWGAVLLFNSFGILGQVVLQQMKFGIARLLAGQEPAMNGPTLPTLYLPG